MWFSAFRGEFRPHRRITSLLDYTMAAQITCFEKCRRFSTKWDATCKRWRLIFFNGSASLIKSLHSSVLQRKDTDMISIDRTSLSSGGLLALAKMGAVDIFRAQGDWSCPVFKTRSANTTLKDLIACSLCRCATSFVEAGSSRCRHAVSVLGSFQCSGHGMALERTLKDAALRFNHLQMLSRRS